MTMTDTDRKPPRMRLWLRLLLVVSLALNLLVAGLAVGAVIRFGEERERVRPPMPLGALLYRELPREDRKLLRDRNIGSREEREARRRADAKELNAALRAVPFDPARIVAFLEREATRQEGLEEAMRQAWLNRVTAMDDTDRAAYADRLQQALEHHGQISGDRDRPPR